MTTTYTRAVLEAEGYELDYIWYLAQEQLPTLTNPALCPGWALPMWEACLRQPGREIWTDAERRASILARIGQAVTEDDIKSFIAAEARCLPGDLTIVVTGYDTDVTTAGLSADQGLAVKISSAVVIPAHMTLTVDGDSIR